MKLLDLIAGQAFCDAQGFDAGCCVHDTEHEDRPARICCWCGRFYSREVRAEHGPSAPAGSLQYVTLTEGREPDANPAEGKS